MTSSRGVICLNLGRSFASPPSRPLSLPTSPPFLPLLLPSPLPPPPAFSQRERKERRQDNARRGEERTRNGEEAGVRGTARSFCFEQLDGTIKVRSHELAVFHEFRAARVWGGFEFDRENCESRRRRRRTPSSVTLIIDRVERRTYVRMYVCTTIYPAYSRNVSSIRCY